MSPTPEAGWFGPPQRPLFGLLHHPEGPARGVAVLCPPLGRQYQASHDTLRYTAEQLAEAGVAALRFDYDGTGDSAGRDDEPGRVKAWLASVAQAAAFARDAVGGPLGLVGLHVGALLAAAAAETVGELDALVLWDACDSGRAFVRRQRALQLLGFGEVDDDTSGIGLPGWWLRRDTASDLEALPPKRLCRHPPERVLVLTRPGEAEPRRLLAHLGARNVEVASAAGHEALFDVEPIDAQVPTEAVSSVVGFVASALAASHQRPRTTGRLRPRRLVTVAAGRVAVSEQVVEVGPERLFGVLSCPADARATRRDAPAILLLSTNTEAHTGPSRLWVTLARRWAALGFRVLRLDLSAVGDSPVPEGRQPFVARHPAHFGDVLQAAAFASPADPADVVLVGLCAGGYQALDSALELHPVGVMAVNPLLRFAPPEFTWGLIDRRRRLCRPPHPLALSSRRLRVSLLRRGLWWALWRLTHLPATRRQARRLAALAAQGTDTYCLCGAEEAAVVLTQAAALGPPGAFTLEVVPGLDHALVPSTHRAAVAELLTARLLERFGSGARRHHGLEGREITGGGGAGSPAGEARRHDPGEGVRRTLSPAAFSRLGRATST